MKYLILLMVFVWSCTPDPITPPIINPPVVDSDTLALLWSKPLQDVGEETHSLFTSYGFGNKLYMTSGISLGDDWHFFKLEQSTGTVIDSLSVDHGSILSWNNEFLHLKSAKHHKVYNQDLSIVLDDEIDRLTTPNSSFYNSLMFRRTKGVNTSYGAIIMKDSNAPESEWKEILRQEREGMNWRPSLSVPEVEVNVNGDTILYYDSYHWDNVDSLGGFQERIDLHAYNMTTGEELWYKEDFTPYKGANGFMPKVHGDYLYFVGKVSVFCLDKYTGEIVWDRVFVGGEGFLGGNDYFIENDLLYVRGSVETLRAFDLYTGEVRWTNLTSGSSFNMYVNEDYIIFSTARLYVLDAKTGEQLYIYDDSRVNSELTYDPETRRIFAAGIGMMYCFEIPEK